MRFIQIIIALSVLCYTVVGADAGGDLSRGNASYLEATFLFHLSSAWRKRLCLQLSLRKEVQALWRRRLWSRRRRCCRRWRLEQRWRRKILGRCGITANAGTCCTESRGAATTAAPSREHCRVRHLPRTNVCSGRGGRGLRRLVHCVGYRGAEEASAISFCTVIFVFKTPGRKTGPDAPPGAIPPSPPPQSKAPAAAAFEGELLRTTQKPPQPLLAPRRRPLQNPPGRSARRQRGASVAFPSPPPAPPPPPASPELSVAQTSPPSPAVPARPSPHAPRTLSNPLGSRRLLREETLAGAARLGAGRRRGARYAEPSNEARAGAQRRRVLAEHGRGAAAAVAAGAQGALHHWQPWSLSIFLPRGRRRGSAHVRGEEGAGARASPEGGGTCASATGCEPLWSSSSAAGSTSPRCSCGPGGRGRQAAAAPFSAALVARRAGAATAADAVQRNESGSITSCSSQEPAVTTTATT